jgi:demethylmenaquinone methyltransferase/2-methoxy-6-polyprenyl-1,4-benzoquinol methylase
MMDNEFTHFGFEKVPLQEKQQRVYHVFESVAPRYNLMNDLMSLGIHRLWKRFAANISGVRPGAHILDVAGGTGDMARLYAKQTGAAGNIVICDINHDMLLTGRDQLLDEGVCRNIRWTQGNAEDLPFAANTFDLVSIAFGLRNVTDKQRALVSMYDKLKYGSPLVILEFSSLVLPLFREMYDKYSYNLIPLLGKYIAHDEQSYRYLVESIRMHPDQETLKQMMINAGFAKVEYHNLSGGIVAVHKGYKI